MQKTGNAVRAISRFSSMGMLGGIGPKKISPTDGIGSADNFHIVAVYRLQQCFFSGSVFGSIFSINFSNRDFKEVFVKVL